MGDTTVTSTRPVAGDVADNGFGRLAADAELVLLSLGDLPAPLAVRADTTCPACLARQTTVDLTLE